MESFFFRRWWELQSRHTHTQGRRHIFVAISPRVLFRGKRVRWEGEGGRGDEEILTPPTQKSERERRGLLWRPSFRGEIANVCGEIVDGDR